jgi:hypothetical protein
MRARTLESQVDATSRSGCAGAFVFAWTDEWHDLARGIDDLE